MSHNSAPAIYLDKINKSFKTAQKPVRVLNNINLTVDEGDFLIIFGPSGCGKSTLLHVILGLEPPTSGSQVKVLGRQIYAGSNNHDWFDEDDAAEFRKEHIGMVYQQTYWIKSQNVVQNVAFPLLLLGETELAAANKARQVLQTVGMLDWADYIPTELSSGQQQRVNLARALITNPEILITDEPTGNLDFQSGQELMEMLVKLNKAGKTIIMVTHDLEYLPYASKAAEMFDGSIKGVYTGEEKKNILKNLRTKKNGVSGMRKTRKKQPILKSLFSYFKLFIELTALILGYLVYKLLDVVLKLIPGKLSDRFAAFSSKSYQKLVDKLDRPQNHSISRLSLIKLSTQNLASKKSRTLITIGGMAVGIGSIVFLVSIGYGLQDLVVSRVARLEELKQTDVIAQPNSELKINDESLSNFNNLTEVDQVLPLISVVGRVTYRQAVSNMAVYGVTSQYLEKSAIQPSRGKVFESDDLAKVIFEAPELVTETRVEVGQVAGVSTQQAKYKALIGEVSIEIEPEVWLRVRAEPNINSEILGYTKRPAGQLTGEEVWGQTYIGAPAGAAGQTEEGEELGKWVKTQVYLWQEDENEKYQPITGDQGEQIQETGFIAQLGMSITPKAEINQVGSVLGVTNSEEETADSTASALAQTNNSGIDWVDVASESGQIEQNQAQQIGLGEQAKQQAVVNRAALSVLGIDETQALGEKFEASFIVMGKDLGQPGEKLESIPSEYEIVGIIPGDKVPMFYVPFLDLRSLGIVNYSQAKLVAANQEDLPVARQKIEAMGFVTRSVVDTVDQIENIFATTRIILGLLGMAALLVASLGMFNTLTVSLLERTREVGLMKALGMKSYEVKELFLIESLTMGLLSGVLGLLLGFLSGKLLSIGLSVFSIARGVGIMDISLIPVGFVVVIIFLAILVGIITGLYPAKRARHISALNALRYE